MVSNSPHGGKRNNFDFLRIVAALLVLISHQSALTGHSEVEIPGYQSLGGLGLLIFFTISGFLVSASWERDPNIVRFAIRRMLRVWPGLAAAVILAACLLGPLATNLSFHQYISEPLTARYFNNLRFVHTDRLPGVFENNPFPYVNGSLWTLPVEVRWYVILGLLGILRIIRWRSILLFGTVALAVHYFFIFDVEKVISEGGERKWKEELGLFFLAGACLQRYRAEWEAHSVIVCCVLVAGSVLFMVFGKNARRLLACDNVRYHQFRGSFMGSD